MTEEAQLSSDYLPIASAFDLSEAPAGIGPSAFPW